MVLELIIAATVLVSLISLVGIALFFLGKKEMESAMFALVSFATGAILGAAFFDLLPESFTVAGPLLALKFVFAGLIAMFVMEKIIHLHHHHHVEHEGEHKHPLGMLTLIGDASHNFLDGVAISAAFMVNVPLGITTTIAVICHEIPHEIGNFSLLLYSGYSRTNALLFNFMSALAAIVGGVAFFFFAGAMKDVESLALAFTAGTFIYIACADIFPELHKEVKLRNAVLQLVLILMGAAMIWAIMRFLE